MPKCSNTPLRWWELLAFKFWPSYFRATAPISFLTFEHDGMRFRAGSYSARGDISKTQRFRVFPRPTCIFRGLFLSFCTAATCKFSKLYFPPQFFCILLSTFVQILNLARPCRYRLLKNLVDGCRMQSCHTLTSGRNVKNTVFDIATKQLKAIPFCFVHCIPNLCDTIRFGAAGASNGKL
jgi:hypothetical protein